MTAAIPPLYLPSASEVKICRCFLAPEPGEGLRRIFRTRLMVLVASKVRGGRVYGLQDEGSNRSDSSRNRGPGDSRTRHRTVSHLRDNREATVVFGLRRSDLGRAKKGS